MKKAGATKDIHPKQAGGIADAAAHVAFCGTSDECNVQRESHSARLAPHCARADVAGKQRLRFHVIGCLRHAGIYDQSVWQNHLGLEGPAQRGHNIYPLRNIQDLPVNFTDPRSKTTLHGQPVFAAFFAGAPAGFDGKPFIGQGYSNRSAQGTAQGDESETLYAVMGNPKEPISGRGNCCFVRPFLPVLVRDCSKFGSGLITVLAQKLTLFPERLLLNLPSLPFNRCERVFSGLPERCLAGGIPLV